MRHTHALCAWHREISAIRLLKVMYVYLHSLLKAYDQFYFTISYAIATAGDSFSNCSTHHIVLLMCRFQLLPIDGQSHIISWLDLDGQSKFSLICSLAYNKVQLRGNLRINLATKSCRLFGEFCQKMARQIEYGSYRHWRIDVPRHRYVSVIHIILPFEYELPWFLDEEGVEWEISYRVLKTMFKDFVAMQHCFKDLLNRTSSVRGWIVEFPGYSLFVARMICREFIQRLIVPPAIMFGYSMKSTDLTLIMRLSNLFDEEIFNDCNIRDDSLVSMEYALYIAEFVRVGYRSVCIEFWSFTFLIPRMLFRADSDWAESMTHRHKELHGVL